MTDRELMQMALDWADNNGEAVFAVGGWEGVSALNKWSLPLRAALAALPEELDLPKVRLEEFLKLIEGKEDFRGIPLMRTEWPTRGEALAQPEPEELAQLEQAMIEAWKPIPQREWQGLTNEEVKTLWDSVIKYVAGEIRINDFARAIEAKLREKNGNL